MIDTVAATAGATVTSPTIEGYSARPATPESSGLDKDAFLKLLVTQLKYQDPLNPTSSDDFIATTAQFTTVEKLDELTKQGANTALISSLTTAGSLVGRTIDAYQNGTEVTTTVQRSRIVSGEVVLETDAGTVRLNEIVSVGPTAPLSTPAPAGTPTETRSEDAAPAPDPLADPDGPPVETTAPTDPITDAPATTNSQETSR